MSSLGKHWKLSEETKKKISKSKTGIKLSKEHRLKLSIAQTGKRGRIVSKETREKLSVAAKKFYANGGKPPMGMLGRKASLETREKLSTSHKGIPKPYISGANCHFWRGGITSKNQKARTSMEIRLWRENVFMKDNWMCQKCKDNTGGNLNAHHIQNFADYPKLRTSIENGITLCVRCHKIFHKQYGRKNTTQNQLEEFLLVDCVPGWEYNEGRFDEFIGEI